LIVLEWFLAKSGIRISFTQLGISWDSRLLVAIIVILTFCLVALSGIPDGGIKEAALVVIGFYFGSAKRKDEDLAGTVSLNSTSTQTPAVGGPEPGNP
jgi:hypothetical protein